MNYFDVVIIGGGAAGLMCAIEAGKRGRQVLVLEGSNKVGKKILMSGGGRCNFTNMHATHENFISDNPHFCKSALARYTQWDFIALVEKHGIAYHEKELGQLFCDISSKQILGMLVSECQRSGVEIQTQAGIQEVAKTAEGFSIQTASGDISCQSLVIATGGLSIPKMGASGFGYDIAQQFGLPIKPTRAALVPLTFTGRTLERYSDLSGVALPVAASCNGQQFNVGMLFTHRGISGPAILQISSYWSPGDEVTVSLMPNRDTSTWLQQQRQERPDAELRTVLATALPKRLATRLCELEFGSKPLKQHNEPQLENIANRLSEWAFRPNGSEGYATAEVTLGGVDTHALSSSTMEARDVPGLYFIGEVVDVTGHLGGFNFQWAWSSGHAAGQVV